MWKYLLVILVKTCCAYEPPTGFIFRTEDKGMQEAATRAVAAWNQTGLVNLSIRFDGPFGGRGEWNIVLTTFSMDGNLGGMTFPDRSLIVLDGTVPYYYGAGRCREETDFQSLLAHEIGHSLGIVGHSESRPGDVMFGSLGPCEKTRKLTKNDVERYRQRQSAGSTSKSEAQASVNATASPEAARF